MGQSAIMLIIFVVLLLAFGIYYLIDKSKNKKGESSSQVSKSESVSSYKKNDREVPRKDMSDFIRFDKIANDMIYQKNGERYTMVIECKGINYELMSDVEQMAVEEGFITFLNTLKFPIQLYVQTRSIDLSENIKKYKARANEFEEKRQDYVAQYNRLEDDIDAKQEDVNELRRQKIKYSNIAEYVADITKYVERLSLNKYLLQRKFYVIISYNKSDIVTTEKFTKEEYEDMCYRELYTRAQGVIGSLMASSVQGRVLNSNELAELIYISLNKDDEKAMNIRDALEAGFYRLYSTSEDVRIKKQEAIDEEIRQEGLKRVEAAIREGIANGTIVSEDDFNYEIDKKIDKTALQMVDKSTLSDKNKEEIKNIITANRKEKLKIREEKLKKEQQERQEEQETLEVVENGVQNKNTTDGILVSEESIIESIETGLKQNSDSNYTADENIV